MIKTHSNMKATNEEILRAIHSFWQRNGYGPSYQDITENTAIASKSTIFKRVKNLEKIGLLRNTSMNRCVSLTEAGINLIQEASA